MIGQVRLPCPFGAGRYLFLANRSEISSNSPDSSISACIHTALPYNPLMFSFIETKLFTRLVQKYLTDDEYQEVQALLIKNPNAGEVVPKTGGVRKLRWRAPGRSEFRRFLKIPGVGRPFSRRQPILSCHALRWASEAERVGRTDPGQVQPWPMRPFARLRREQPRCRAPPR